MTTYRFVVEISDEFPWTVEDVELAVVATFYDVIETRRVGVTVRPFDPEHPSLRGYPHGHLREAS